MSYLHTTIKVLEERTISLVKQHNELMKHMIPKRLGEQETHIRNLRKRMGQANRRIAEQQIQIDQLKRYIGQLDSKLDQLEHHLKIHG